MADAVVRSGMAGADGPPSYWFAKVPNLGDAVAPALIRHLTGTDPVWVSKRYRGKLLTVGSVLDRVRPGDVVWGTGALRPKRIRAQGATYLAVRGPLTRELIEGMPVPEVYGDPALLLPRIHRPSVEPRYSVGVVPHYADQDAIQSPDPERVPVIDVREPWRSVVDRIRACRTILSSSLHGLVVAEAYGIPAVWIRAGDRLVGGDFKFRDYYLGTHREPPEPAPWSRGAARALERAEAPPPLDPSPLEDAWTAWMAATSMRGSPPGGVPPGRR